MRTTLALAALCCALPANAASIALVEPPDPENWLEVTLTKDSSELLPPTPPQDRITVRPVGGTGLPNAYDAPTHFWIPDLFDAGMHRLEITFGDRRQYSLHDLTAEWPLGDVTIDPLESRDHPTNPNFFERRFVYTTSAGSREAWLEVRPVPEPASAWLLGVGCLMLRSQRARLAQRVDCTFRLA